MKRFLQLVLLAGSLVAVRSCERICELLYNNPYWQNHTSYIEDTSFEIRVERGKVTGIITANLELFWPNYGYGHDYLRFYARASGEPNQALAFRIGYSSSGDHTHFIILGETHKEVGNFDVKKMESTRESRKGPNKSKAGSVIQISDLSPDYYEIYLGDPGEPSETNKRVNYNFSERATWNWFQNNNVRLQDTVRIKNDGRCTVYKNISVCPDATPRLCDEEHTVTEAVDLSFSHTMSCTASGAPYLDVEWTKDGEPTIIEPKNTFTTFQADHRVVSTLTISGVTIHHLGTWTCAIRNKNFGNNVTKTYKLLYVSSPDLDYY